MERKSLKKINDLQNLIEENIPENEKNEEKSLKTKKRIKKKKF